MTARQQQRRRRLQHLLDQHGIAQHCDVATAHDALPRWALLEQYAGPGSQRPWWTLGGDWSALLEESAGQLHAGDWPASSLFDLDSQFCTSIVTAYHPRFAPPTHHVVAGLGRVLRRRWRSLAGRARRAP